MELKILQLRDTKKYGFMSYKFAKEHDFSLADYDVVWEGNIDSDNSLDDIFRMFNRTNQGDCEYLDRIGFKGHSMSTSDIIDLDGTKYYCDSHGWVDLATEKKI